MFRIINEVLKFETQCHKLEIKYFESLKNVVRCNLKFKLNMDNYEESIKKGPLILQSIKAYIIRPAALKFH